MVINGSVSSLLEMSVPQIFSNQQHLLQDKPKRAMAQGEHGNDASKEQEAKAQKVEIKKLTANGKNKDKEVKK
eukprot:NP_510601.2 Uncharacterized protein CELE_Y7A5A.8 [Caenorhabditis elegans]